jgi:hypothetical protein
MRSATAWKWCGSGSAIVDAVADDPARTEALFEVWSELEEQRKLS